MEIVCNIAMADIQVVNLLYPLTENDIVSKLWIIRHQRPKGNISKAHYIIVSNIRIVRFSQMLYHSIRLAFRKDVKWFVSINPFPYGLISFIAAKMTGKKIHFGFIGGDWNKHLNSLYGKFLMPFVKKS